MVDRAQGVERCMVVVNWLWLHGVVRLGAQQGWRVGNECWAGVVWRV
jgi:hypothetical protein